MRRTSRRNQFSHLDELKFSQAFRSLGVWIGRLSDGVSDLSAVNECKKEKKMICSSSETFGVFAFHVLKENNALIKTKKQLLTCVAG